jgi:hypothetical protein
MGKPRISRDVRREDRRQLAPDGPNHRSRDTSDAITPSDEKRPLYELNVIFPRMDVSSRHTCHRLHASKARSKSFREAMSEAASGQM